MHFYICAEVFEKLQREEEEFQSAELEQEEPKKTNVHENVERKQSNQVKDEEPSI